MRLTVCCETVFTDRPLTDRFAPVRAQHIHGVELWGLPAEAMPDIQDAIASTGCRLELFCGNRDHSLIDESEREGFIGELKQSFAHAAKLECRRLTILSDKVDARGIPIPPDRPHSNEQKSESLFAGLKKAARLAEAENITLLLEPLNTKIDHPGFTLFQSSDAFDIVRQIGAPHLKVLYDVYHMAVMGEDVIAALESNLADVGHVHVADAPGRHEPGTGSIDYRRVADMLRANAYEGCVGLECIPRGESHAAIAAFRRLFE